MKQRPSGKDCTHPYMIPGIHVYKLNVHHKWHTVLEGEGHFVAMLPGHISTGGFQGA